MRPFEQCITRKAVSGALALLIAFLLVPSAAFAQVETGQVTGTVSDPQGAVISGATVTVTSTDNGSTRSVKTTGDGNYNVTNLQPGNYEVKVEGAGFGSKTIPVRVTIGTATTVDAQLEVGGSGESIDVVAGDQGVQVNTENQTLQTVVSEKQIKELPTITRDPYSLVQLSGNVSDGDPTARGVGFNINGQRASSTNVLLDGADNNDNFGATVGQRVPLDSVQEFTVLTSNFSAEFGRASGGIVNVATKAGSNDFHGTVYEFNRLSRLASKDFNVNSTYTPDGGEIKKGVFTRNQFGYSVGGPVVKDKLFFFNSLEWIRVRSQDTFTSYVPTPEFIAASAPATQTFFSNFPLDQAINGRIITAGQLSPTPGGALAALGSNFPVFGAVTQSIPTDAGGGLPENEYQLVGRADYNWTDKTTIYGRYALQSQDFFEGTNAFSPYSGFNTGLTAFNNNALVSMTHVWTDTFVSQTKFVYNRLNQNQPLGDNAPSPTLYLASGTAASALPAAIGGDAIALPGYLPFTPGSAIPFGGPQNLAQFYQDQTWTLGNHAVRFGGTYIRINDNRTFGAYQNAVEQVGTNLQKGLDNFLLGNYTTFQVAIDPQGHFPGEQVTLPTGSPKFDRNNRYNEYALYVNDSWKVLPRVTLNLGLRYDYFGVQHNKDESLDSNFYFGSGANLQEQVANGTVQLAGDSPVGSLWAKDKNNFGPRVGIAWDVFGDGKTSLRGGYGLSYERNFGNVTFNVIQNPPNYAVVSLTNPAGSPIITDNLGPFAAGSGTITLPATSLRAVDPNIKTAYAHFWSAAVEHQFGTGLVASVEYSGSAGRDLYSIVRANLPFSAIHYGLPYDPATNPLGYENSQYSVVNLRTNGGFSNYNGLTFGLDSRVIGNTGLQFQAKYTWSHALDNLSSTFSEAGNGNSFNLGFLDPENPRLDYGPADFDVRHRFVTSGIWDVPYGKNIEGPLKQVLGGWEVSYIFTARTGSPFSVYDCTNGFYFCARLLNAGNLQTEGFAHPAEVEGEATNTFRYLDLTNQLSQLGSYADPLTGVDDFGPFPSNMTGRNAFRGPGFWNLDGGVYKNFSLTERDSLQFRAEFFNVFNHANLFANAGSAELDASPIVTASKAGRRQVQLALKFIF